MSDESRHEKGQWNETGEAPEAAGNEAAEDSGEGLSREQALQRLTEAEEKLASQKEEVLRAHAEVHNMRRRTEQDVEKAHKYGQEKLVGELLAVIDNLERALQAVPDKEDPQVQALYQGVELTLKSFMDTLNRFNVQSIDPEGEPFDPQRHEAMTLQENDEVEPNTVVAVMQKGYTLHGRVIRPARVIVSRSSSSGVDEKA
ncbi:MAG: nucleotide exchange factor GrpE [Pseudohongiellaceae bacterium]